MKSINKEWKCFTNLILCYSQDSLSLAGVCGADCKYCKNTAQAVQSCFVCED